MNQTSPQGDAPPTAPASRFNRNTVLLLVSAALFILAGWIFFNRQYVIDQIRLAGYRPPQEVRALAEATTMQGEGERYFYATRPLINGREEFNRHCSDRGEQTLVLGCYNGLDIYIFNVEDERLRGVEEVTAAHEMLHAAYDRLGRRERERVDGLVRAEVDKLGDPRLVELVKLYNTTDPGALLNEMHSIIATEVRDISPELEEHYRRYFADRKKVVALSEGYEKVFTDLKNQQDALSGELDRLNGEIRTRTQRLNGDIQRLNADIEAFNRRADSGDFSSQAEFRQERDRLVERQTALSAERRAINALISRFNTIRQQLAELNLQAQSLNRSLDSNPPQEVPSL